MKSKQSGFVTIECIISMTIICIGLYIISTCMYNSYSFINLNQKKFEMLNIAKKEIEKYKHDIKYSEKQMMKKSYYNSENDRYNIKTIVQEEKYYQCFKINVEVYDTTNKIGLDGYVFKK